MLIGLLGGFMVGGVCGYFAKAENSLVMAVCGALTGAIAGLILGLVFGLMLAFVAWVAGKR